MSMAYGLRAQTGHTDTIKDLESRRWFSSSSSFVGLAEMTAGSRLESKLFVKNILTNRATMMPEFKEDSIDDVKYFVKVSTLATVH